MMRRSMKSVRIMAVLAGLGGVASVGQPVRAATTPTPSISEGASAAVALMGKSLLAEQFSVQARTLRVYPGPGGQPLHIAHSMKITVHRPNKLLVDVTGDDGSVKLFYDGKSATLFGVEANKYVTGTAPDTIQGLLDGLTDRLNVDFPLADLLSAAPDKSVLSGVVTGKEINTVTIDGVECRHLLFTERPGVEIELWLEKNDRSLPRRLIITYYTMSGHPNIVAELSNWDFSVHPSDADFVFQPPKDSVQVETKPAGVSAKPAGAKP